MYYWAFLSFWAAHTIILFPPEVIINFPFSQTIMSDIAFLWNLDSLRIVQLYLLQSLRVPSYVPITNLLLSILKILNICPVFSLIYILLAYAGNYTTFTYWSNPPIAKWEFPRLHIDFIEFFFINWVPQKL